MAQDLINEIIGQKVFDDFDKLNGLMDGLMDRFGKINAAAIKSETSMRKAGSVSEYNKALSQLNGSMAEYEKAAKDLGQIEKEELKLKQKLIAANAQIANSNTSYAKELAKLNERKRQTNTQNRLEAKSVLAVEGSYNAMQVELSKVINEYKNLANVQKSAYGNELLKRAEALNKELYAIDSKMGIHTRNVGNYNGAVMAMSQVLREAPAFANSLQTGLMGISNNIPILVDEISKLKAVNTELVASGQKAIPIWKTLGKSFLSTSNILTLSLTLYLLLKDRIDDMIGSMNLFSKTSISAKQNQEDLSTAMLEGAKNAVKERMELDILYKKTQDTTVSIKERKKAVDELQNLFPAYFKNIKDETILNGGAEKQYLQLRDAILASARARAIEDKLVERAQNRLEEEFALQDKINEVQKEIKKGGGVTLPAVKDDFGKTLVSAQKITEKEMQQLRLKRKGMYEKELQDLKDKWAKEDELLVGALDEQMKIQGDYGKKIVNEKKKKDKDPYQIEVDQLERAMNAKRRLVAKDNLEMEKNNQFNEEAKRRSNTRLLIIEIEHLNRLIQLKSKYNKDASAELVTVEEKNLELLQRSKEEAFDAMKTVQELNKDGLISDEDLKKINADIDKISLMLRKLGEEAKVQLEIDEDSREKFLRDLVDAANKIEGIIGRVGALSTALNAQAAENINKQKKDLEDRYSEEEELINARYTNQAEREKQLAALAARKKAQQKALEQQELAIKQRQARFDKAVAVASITVRTAQAVMAALAQYPPNYPGAVYAGVTGALELATALAVPIPQYAEGTDDHKGGLAIVGERGKELVVEPGKQPYFTPDRPTLMDLSKHARVIPNNELMSYLHAATFPKLVNTGKIGVNDYERALLESFEEMTYEVKAMRKEMSGIRVEVNNHIDAGRHDYIESNIK